MHTQPHDSALPPARSKTCDPSFGKETEQAVVTTGAQGQASPCPSPSVSLGALGPRGKAPSPTSWSSPCHAGFVPWCPPQLTKHTASYHKAFGELAKQEALLACFSCAWQREMPYRGRLYISSHHICFHSSLLVKDIKVGWGWIWGQQQAKAAARDMVMLPGSSGTGGGPSCLHLSP